MMSIEEFFDLKDKNIQIYTYKYSNVQKNVRYYKFIDNEEKIGWYIHEKSIQLSNSGGFYRKDVLLNWIVYDKKSKKVKCSKNIQFLSESFLVHFFGIYHKLVMSLVVKPTKTFIKKVVEGKIKTVQDIIKYHQSYTVKSKINLEGLYKFSLSGQVSYARAFKNPEGLRFGQRIENYFSFFKNGEFDINDEIGSRDKYESWKREQREKLGKTGDDVDFF